MKIAVVGGGNLGTLISANLSLADGAAVTLLTRKSGIFSNVLRVVDEERGSSYDSGQIAVTDDYSQALTGADIVLCTLPSFLRGAFAKKAEPYLSPQSAVGFVPGSGGVEFACADLIRKGITVFGMQRVPYICRTLEYGKTCLCKSSKEQVFIGSIPGEKALELCGLLEPLFGIDMIPLRNYLTVTLTPSNPILHTSRMYSLFKDYSAGSAYERIPLFYHDWDDDSSRTLLGCDGELQALCEKIEGMDLSGVVPLSVHYESGSAEALTAKLRGIAAFSGIGTPMVRESGGYVPDWDSRYFTEDYPYGLAIIKGFSLLAGCPTPHIDASLFWYQNMSGKTYFSSGGGTGRDLPQCGAPQRYGFRSLEEVLALY